MRSLLSQSKAVSAPQPQAKILLVDHSVNGCAARKAVLQEAGHKVTTAATGSEALELFSNHKFDLMVTDHKLPRMDGPELILRVRKQAPQLPIVLISAFADTLGVDEKSSGADAVVQKSANEVAHLTRAVHRLLRKKPEKKPVSPQSGPAKSKRKTG